VSVILETVEVVVLMATATTTQFPVLVECVIVKEATLPGLATVALLTNAIAT
jgi:hypothetical protein